MASLQGYVTPSHILYVDDIFVSCRADNKSLRNLSVFLKIYEDFSVNMLITLRLVFSPWIILQDLSPKFNIFFFVVLVVLPFTYLGVPIFVGAPKCRFLQPLANKVKLKLASMKGKSLSMMGRIQLVVITRFLTYSFNMYKWHVSLLKQVEQWCRNFI